MNAPLRRIGVEAWEVLIGRFVSERERAELELIDAHIVLREDAIAGWEKATAVGRPDVAEKYARVAGWAWSKLTHGVLND
jgi:hypothetical protein